MNLTTTSRILIQGMTEPLGRVYAPLMQRYGTRVVAGVAAGQGGETCNEIPIYDLVEQAVEVAGGIDASVLCGHPYGILDAALEAIAAGIRQLVLLSEGVPPLDMIRLLHKAEATETLVVGPNSPGIIVPGQILLGTHPPEFYTPGSVGVISRSGTLTYEISRQLTQAGLGQSLVVGIGGDRIVGSSLQQWFQILEEDEQTEVIVLIGEVGGDSEEIAAHYISEAIDKPVVAYLAGRTVPLQPVMGHTGEIVTALIPDLNAEIGTVESKLAAFRRAGVVVGDRPSKIPDLVKQALRETSAA